MADGKNNKTPTVVGDYVLLRPDRRKELRRHMLVLRVNGENENTFFGYSKNLSKGGMFIASVNPKKTGEEFTISFNLPQDMGKVVSRCRVMWSREYDPKSQLEPGMGIKFLDMDVEMEKRLEEWIKKG